MRFSIYSYNPTHKCEVRFVPSYPDGSYSPPAVASPRTADSSLPAPALSGRQLASQHIRTNKGAYGNSSGKFQLQLRLNTLVITFTLVRSIPGMLWIVSVTKV